MDLKPGSRWKSAVCDTEVVVVRPPKAETSLESAKGAYENARQQEINDVATAQAQIDDARVQLNESRACARGENGEADE